MTSYVSIRSVIATLGAVSILIAGVLAGFGLLGVQTQLDARKRIVVLEMALKNHDAADAAMDSARTDVLRALQSALGTDREGSEVIQHDLVHHIEQFDTGLAGNLVLPINASLHASYEQIFDRMPAFRLSSKQAVALALIDPIAGSANYESFRQNFTDVETLMDVTRDVVREAVQDVRREGGIAAQRGRWMIVSSFVGGSVLLAFNTLLAMRIGQRITTELARSREEAHHRALHDTLTDLPNRSYLAERLHNDQPRDGCENTPIGLLCIDLDRFKQVNDSFGHPIGDQLLQAVANRLRNCVRRCDTVVRMGGDEFAIIQSPIETPQLTEAFAHRIVTTLSEPYLLSGHSIVIGASVGIALGASNTARDDLFVMADAALYRAKAAGRGTACLFEAAMDRRGADQCASSVAAA